MGVRRDTAAVSCRAYRWWKRSCTDLRAAQQRFVFRHANDLQRDLYQSPWVIACENNMADRRVDDRF